MNPFKRNRHLYSSDPLYGWEIEQRALSVLVSRHPSDYVMMARKEIQQIPNGGSIIPWRYKRQVQTAIDATEHLLVARYTQEWLEICEMLQHGSDIAKASPDDFKQ